MKMKIKKILRFIDLLPQVKTVKLKLKNITIVFFPAERAQVHGIKLLLLLKKDLKEQ